MVIKSGIFTEPGVIVEKSDDGTVTIDTEPLTINKFHRYGDTTGLTAVEKEKYNSILDSIYKETDQMKRLNALQKEIDALRVKPEMKNIVEYLRNQQAMIIRKVTIPRFYTRDQAEVHIKERIKYIIFYCHLVM